MMQEGRGNWQNMFQRPETRSTWTSQPLTTCKTYYFRYQLTNVCGTSLYSSREEIIIDKRPDPPTRLTLTKAGCSMQLTWTKPAACSPVEQYRVSISGRTGFAPITNCGGDVGIARCTLKRSDVYDSPWNLNSNDDIVFKVEAYNRAGWSNASNTKRVGPRDLPGLPPKVGKCYITKDTNPKNVRIEWTGITTIPAVTSYSVYNFN